VIVPYLRGYGPTRFLSEATFRNGRQSALGVDVVALMDALGIERAIIAGLDWGARTAGVMAALWPERCRAIVSVSGYLIGSQKANQAPLPPTAELQWWYQYYFATERGHAGYERYRVEIVIHNYRWRIGLAEGEPAYEDLEQRLAEFPVITVPAITLEGDANGAPHPEPASYAERFTGKYNHRLVAGGVGHNLPQEAPRPSPRPWSRLTATDRRAP
jgi:pimeloyl-ACP methyl ester carboxylesterase